MEQLHDPVWHAAEPVIGNDGYEHSGTGRPVAKRAVRSPDVAVYSLAPYASLGLSKGVGDLIIEPAVNDPCVEALHVHILAQ